MLFKSIGSVSDYIKNMSLERKWQERRKNPLMAKGKDENPLIAQFRKQLEDSKKQQEIAAIDNKLKSGSELSEAEMEHLKNNAPELYKKAIAIKKEREAYRKELEQCTNKEEARNLHIAKISNSLSIKSDGDYTAMRIAALQNEYNSFTGKSEFSKLPKDISKAANSQISNNVDAFIFSKTFENLSAENNAEVNKSENSDFEFATLNYTYNSNGKQNAMKNEDSKVEIKA